LNFIAIYGIMSGSMDQSGLSVQLKATERWRSAMAEVTPEVAADRPKTRELKRGMKVDFIDPAESAKYFGGQPATVVWITWESTCNHGAQCHGLYVANFALADKSRYVYPSEASRQWKLIQNPEPQA
jgi:hypothetical protein